MAFGFYTRSKTYLRRSAMPAAIFAPTAITLSLYHKKCYHDKHKTKQPHEKNAPNSRPDFALFECIESSSSVLLYRRASLAILTATLNNTACKIHWSVSEVVLSKNRARFRCAVFRCGWCGRRRSRAARCTPAAVALH